MRIAAVQCRSIQDDPDAVGDIVADRLRWADAEAVGLVLFPEAFLLGHSYDVAVIAARAERERDVLTALCRRIAGFRATTVVGAFEAGDG